MATFHSMTGGLGGFTHRLSKIYQDTKNLYDFIEPPKVSGSPEFASLHRKLRIQKDRLIAWGLQWSEKSSEKGQLADIDESLDKAGSGDVVGSVLATIKEIIAEADPLWQSSRALMAGSVDDKLIPEALRSVCGEKAVERRPLYAQWDRARFEELVNDLTVSIDTLYDISRNCQRPSTGRSRGNSKEHTATESEAAAASMSGAKISVSKEPQFDSSRFQTPQQINPDLLIIPGDIHGTLLKPTQVATNAMGQKRRIVCMRRQSTSNNPWKRDGGIHIVPVLLEWAVFDEIVASTGIGPSMDKFEKLFAGLQNSRNIFQRGDFSVLNLIGYFEDVEGSRLGLIYELPKQFRPVEVLANDGDSRLPVISTMSDLLTFNEVPPPLEIKFTLAYKLAITVFQLLAKNVLHGNVASDNVLFFYQEMPPDLSAAAGDIRQPFLTSFDLFSITEMDGLSSYSEFVEFGYSSHASAKENGEALDLKGLALLLLEVGLWTPLKEIANMRSATSNADNARLPETDFFGTSEICARLATQCGTLYSKAVQSCWQAGIIEVSQSSQRDPGRQVKLYWKVVKALEKCCAIDEDFEPEGFNTVTSPSPQIAAISSNRTSAKEEKRDHSNPAELASKTKPKTGPSTRYQHEDDIELPESHAKSKVDQNAGSGPQNPAELASPTKTPAVTSSRYHHADDIQLSGIRVQSKDDNDSGSETLVSTRPGYKALDRFMRPYPVNSTIIPFTEPNASVSSQKSTLYEKSVMDIPINAVASIPKRKLRLYPTTNMTQKHWDDWNTVLMPRINRVLRGFYRKHPESVEISLVSMGETAQETKPTILAICTSVDKVKDVLKRSFSYDKSTYNLKVCRGKILRSRKKRPPCQSMADPLDDIHELGPAANTDHQVYPHFGASIGACVEGRNMPPVSLGGTLEIEGVIYGMSVHHMLEGDDDLEDLDEDDARNPLRSSGYSAASDSEGFYYSSDGLMQLGAEPGSSYESEVEDEDDMTETSSPFEAGDREGIPVDCGEGYYITQPAIDDVADEFFTSSDERDEEHVDSHALGEMYASSGIRRTRANGQVHEIDWALFTFKKERLPPPTLTQEGKRRFCKGKSPYPSGTVPCSELRDLSVHGMGRSSGLRAGKISTGMTSVKLYGRKTPSQSYEVKCVEKQGNMLGIPGDSGAWIIDSESGRVCGSVLAWSSRKRIAYICPMDILLEHIAKVLDTERVSLGNGEVVFRRGNGGSDFAGPEFFSMNSVETRPHRRTAGIINDLISDNSADSEADADDEDDTDENDEEECNDNDTRSIENDPLGPPCTGPIRFKRNEGGQRERELPAELIPAMDKMKITADVTVIGGSLD